MSPRGGAARARSVLVFLLLVALAGGTACEKETRGVTLPAANAAEAGTAPPVAGAPPQGAAPTDPTVGTGGAPASPSAAAVTAPTPAAAASDGVVLTAATEPHRRSTITPSVGGRVQTVHVRDGQIVAAGDALVTLDSSDFVLRKRQAEAAVRAARTAQSTAKTEWKRLKKLVDERAIPAQQFDMVDGQVEGATAQVAQAQVAVEMTAKAIADSVIYAPYAGVVVKRHVNEGEYAAVMPPTPLVTLEEVDVLDLRVQVPSDLMARVREGTALTVWFAALQREVPARVTRVVPSLDPRTRTFSVVAEIPNPDRTLWPGMFADVRLADEAPGVSPASVPAPAPAAAVAVPAPAPAPAAPVAPTAAAEAQP